MAIWSSPFKAESPTRLLFPSWSKWFTFSLALLYFVQITHFFEGWSLHKKYDIVNL